MREAGKFYLCVAAIGVLMVSPLAWAQDDGAAAASQPTLYERLGGLAPISIVVSDFIDALVPDAVLNQNPEIAAARARVPPSYLKYHVTALVCEVTGGPCKYAGRGMKVAHAHLNITEGEWDRMVTIFTQILDRYGVPSAEQQELFTIVGSTKGEIVMAAEEHAK